MRPARADDAPELARLAAELGYPTSIDIMRRRCSALEDRSDHVVFVAERSGGGLIGWAHVASTVTLESGESAELLGLVVDRTARRAGAGRRLVAAAEKWSRERGLERLVVRSNVRRTEAHHFYPSLGYAPTKTQHVYLKKLTSSDPA